MDIYSFISEKAMATHSSTLAWQIPWMEEPGRLQSMGSLGIGHDWATSLSLFTFMHWKRKWQPTPVFLPGEPQGRGSLVGCLLWGRKESDTTEGTYQQQQQQHSFIFLSGNSLPESQMRNLSYFLLLFLLFSLSTPYSINCFSHLYLYIKHPLNILFYPPIVNTTILIHTFSI